MAAHEQADAIVHAGKNQWRFSCAQPFSAAAAERVAEKDRVEAGIVGCVDTFLQVWAHAYAKIVQAHWHDLDFDRMG